MWEQIVLKECSRTIYRQEESLEEDLCMCNNGLELHPKIIHLEFLVIYSSRQAFTKIPRLRHLHPE